LSDFEKGQIAGASLAEASVTKTVILLGVSRGTVSKAMSGIMGRQHQRRGTVGEKQH
jgi:hypothetical protein